ncbi:hypothetical protein [Kitasatospora sp. NPDC086791]|uniref:hypothetical protein n=1 Tax=Kitasatospora sp. NPDC086791 TaxID=3155178 RepID=UPI0034367B77
MSSHYAIADVWIGNLDSEDEADHITEIIDTALGAAGYHGTVTVTARAYDTGGGDQ